MLFLVHLSDNPGAAVTTLPVASDSNQRTKLMHLNIMLHALSIPSGWAYHYHNQGRRLSPAEPQLSALTSQSGSTATVPTTPSHWPSPNANPTRKVAARVPPARGSSATSLIGLQALKLRSNQQSKPGQQCPRVPSSRGRGGACHQSIKQSVPLPPRSIQPSSFFLPVVPVFGSSIHRTLGIQFQGLPSLPTRVVQANSILSVPNQRNKSGSRKQREFCRTQTRVLGGIARSDVFW
jgi:hypothetical protein